MNEHQTKNVFKTVPFQSTAAAGGTALNIPYGTVRIWVRPQDAVTIKFGASTVAVDLTANVWNGPFGFDADGVTGNYITLTGANIETHTLCDVDTELNTDTAVWT